MRASRRPDLSGRKKRHLGGFVVLQYLFIFAVLILSLKVFSAEILKDSYCSNLSGVRELSHTTFVYENTERSFDRRSLISESAGILQFIEVSYTQDGIQILNRLPELGLPISFYKFVIEVIDMQGNVVSNEIFPSEDACDELTLFPGSRSRLFKVPVVDDPAFDHSLLRLRVRSWAATNGY